MTMMMMVRMMTTMMMVMMMVTHCKDKSILWTVDRCSSCQPWIAVHNLVRHQHCRFFSQFTFLFLVHVFLVVIFYSKCSNFRRFFLTFGRFYAHLYVLLLSKLIFAFFACLLLALSRCSLSGKCAFSNLRFILQFVLDHEHIYKYKL